MRTRLFLIYFILNTAGLFGQGNYTWIKQYGSVWDDVGYTIVADDNSIYVGGWF